MNLFFKNLIIFFAFIVLFSKNAFPINIEETIQSTIENNPKIKIGLEKINEARELVKNASGQLLPDISGTITGDYVSSEKETKTSTTEDDTFTDTYKLTVTKNLYDAGYDKLEIKRSKILLDNEILNFKVLIQDLILDAINGYLTVLNFEKSLEANQKNYEVISKAYNETYAKYDLGSATLYDLQNIESSFVTAESNLFLAKQNLEIGKKTFKRISNLEAKDLIDTINIEPNLDINLLEESALSNNLSLALIKNDIQSKEILLLKERKTKQPNLDFTGSAEYSDADRYDDNNETETTKGSLKLTLTIPIFQQGIDNSNIRKYHSQILQSELSLQDTKDQLILDIANTFKNFQYNKSKIKSNELKIKANNTLLLILNEEYKIGTKTLSDLIKEEENLLYSKVESFNSKKDFLISYFELRLLDGTLLDIFNKYLPDLS